MNIKLVVLSMLVGLGCSSCAIYKQDFLFRTDKEVNVAELRKQTSDTERNYAIQKNDLIELEVYTNKGERIIDPDFQLMKEMPGGQMQNARKKTQYLVQEDGRVKLPMVGHILLEGYTLNEADSVLAEAYNQYYKNTFVITQYVNKRVIVLGATATGGQVIPLLNEDMNLIEVLALAGGITGTGKAYNIRLIRGDLDNPQVQVINLSTVEGMKQASLKVQPGDIVYVEPIRRVFNETVRDIAPVVGLLTSALTLLIVIIR